MAAGRDHVQHRWDDLADALPGEGADEEHGHVAEKLQFVAHLLGEGVHGVGVFFDRVPLVDDDDYALLLFEHVARNVGVLRGDALGRVDQQQGDVGAINGLHTAQDTVLLDARLDTAAPADACRVHEGDGLAVEYDLGVNRVARRAGNGADDGALAADQGVEQAALADVGPPHNGDADGVALLLLVGIGRKGGDHLVEQVAHAVTVVGADRVRLREAEVPELHRIETALLAFGLVDGDEEGLVGEAQHFGDVLVGRGQPLAPVHDEDDGVGLVECDLDLVADEVEEMG